MERALDAMWKTYETVNEWVRFADAKAGAILAADAAIVTIVLAALPAGSAAGGKQALASICLALGATVAVASAVYALRCLQPTLTVGEPTSLIYFAHIAQRYQRAGDYAKEAYKVWSDDGRAIEEVGTQVWANACVAWKKYQLMARATQTLVAALFLGLASLALRAA